MSKGVLPTENPTLIATVIIDVASRETPKNDIVPITPKAIEAMLRPVIVVYSL